MSKNKLLAASLVSSSTAILCLQADVWCFLWTWLNMLNTPFPMLFPVLTRNDPSSDSIGPTPHSTCPVDGVECHASSTPLCGCCFSARARGCFSTRQPAQREKNVWSCLVVWVVCLGALSLEKIHRLIKITWVKQYLLRTICKGHKYIIVHWGKLRNMPTPLHKMHPCLSVRGSIMLRSNGGGSRPGRQHCWDRSLGYSWGLGTC